MPEQTYRVRLFRFKVEELNPNEYLYAVAHDTLENPHETTHYHQPPQNAELLFAHSSIYENIVEDEYKRFRRGTMLKITGVVDFRDIGTI